jgi:cation diffusion facilitator family transporter
MTERPGLSRFAGLSIAAAVVTIALKVGAWRLTGSVGLLSDALESGVNLVAAIMTLVILAVAARPPDEEHAYGYGKAEYVSSGAEGALIIVAAVAIAWAAAHRLVHPEPVEELGVGLALSLGASVVNLAVGRILIRAGRRHHSIALEADGHHLMTDVWTSAGVIAAIAAVAVTGWTRLDPIIAIVVAVQIVFTGVRLIRRSWLGILDRAIAGPELTAVRGVLDRYSTAEGVRFHAVWTRQAGARRFVSMHVLVPGAWSVTRGHQLLDRIEEDVSAAIPNAHVFTHLEALEDPASFADQHLDRVLPGSAPRP